MKKVFLIYYIDGWGKEQVVGVANSLDEAIEMVKSDEDIMYNLEADNGSVGVYEHTTGEVYKEKRVFTTTDDFDRARILGEDGEMDNSPLS